MRSLIKAIEPCAHVEGAVVPALAIGCGAIHRRGRRCPGIGGQGAGAGHRQVDGVAPGMIGYASHVTQAPEVLLVDPWIELGLERITRLGGEAPHVRHRTGRSIAVEHLQAVTLGFQRGLHPGEGFGGVHRQQALRRLITLERMPGEVVGAGVADVLLDARINGAQVHHVLGLWRVGHARCGEAQAQHQQTG
ncbi:hypothetical protein D3C76_1239350 [compost metagenome]